MVTEGVHASASTAQTTTQTALLIPNLHCPSCVANIQEILSRLGVSPSAINCSYLTHRVDVLRPSWLALPTISDALEKEGYEIYSIVEEKASGTEARHLEVSDQPNDRPLTWFEHAVDRWLRNDLEAGTDKVKRQKHIQNCAQCRDIQSKGAIRENPDFVKEDSSRRDLVVVDKHSDQPDEYEVTLAVGGMTCSSCTGRVQEALLANDWVKSANVSLITNSASVKFSGQHVIQELVDAIEDIGYEASIDTVKSLSEQVRSEQHKSDGSWKALYAIGGMTCSACVGTITNLLNQHDWIESVDVALISNTATVTFSGKDHLAEIEEIITDAGYDAKLVELNDPTQISPKSSERKISIRIEGMYCEHCPPKVIEAVSSFNGLVKVEEPPTDSHPIISLSYEPSPPNFTIRHILETITASDQGFSASVFHPLTIEERSRAMHTREQRRLLLRVILAVTVAIPTFVIGIVFMSLVPSSNSVRQYLMHPIWTGSVSRAEWSLFIMATPVYFFAADAFHTRAIKELKALWRPGSRTPLLQRFYHFGSMNMLMSMGTTIAYFSSIAELAIAATQPSDSSSSNSSYFDSVVFLTMFLLIGRLLEAFSKSKTGEAVSLLGNMRPTEALLVEGTNMDSNQNSKETSTRHVPIDLLEVGDTVRVVQGGSPPCDGIVVEGETEFDESSLTGESRLVHKNLGDKVYSGTINKRGPILVRILDIAGTTMLDQIVKVVREGQTRRAPVERVADILTKYFTPFVTYIALLTWIIWLALGFSGVLPKDYLDIQTGGWALWSLQFAIAVFVVACPCGIGLAAPTALFVGGAVAAHNGILAKGGGEAFQEASDLDCIVFDKTGTITQGGEPVVTDFELVEQLGGIDSKVLLGFLCTLEESSSHPIAKAVVSFCHSRDSADIKSNSIQEVAGKGVRGTFTVGDTEFEVLVGNESFMLENSVTISQFSSKTLNGWKIAGKSVSLLAVRNMTTDTLDLRAIFSTSDPLRPEAPHIISTLKQRGITTYLLTGDNPITAQAVAAQVGIAESNVIAGVLPHEKADKISMLQKSLHRSSPRYFGIFGKLTEDTRKRALVAMVGDGINDAPALTVADVGIAIGSGSDVAISSAKFVLVSSNLVSVLTLIDLSRVVFRRIKFNFGWALIYNVIMIPIAAGALYAVKSGGGHVRLDPVWASLAMALSSVSVICSSLLLRTTWPIVGFRGGKSISGEAA